MTDDEETDQIIKNLDSLSDFQVWQANNMSLIGHVPGEALWICWQAARASALKTDDIFGGGGTATTWVKLEPAEKYSEMGLDEEIVEWLTTLSGDILTGFSDRDIHIVKRTWDRARASRWRSASKPPEEERLVWLWYPSGSKRICHRGSACSWSDSGWADEDGSSTPAPIAWHHWMTPDPPTKEQLEKLSTHGAE